MAAVQRLVLYGVLVALVGNALVRVPAILVSVGKHMRGDCSGFLQSFPSVGSGPFFLHACKPVGKLGSGRIWQIPSNRVFE